MKTQKPVTAPYRELTQSTKSNNDKDLPYNLAQPQNIYKKEFLIVWSMPSKLSKALLFLSRHKAQKHTQQSSFPSLLHFFTHKGLVPTQKDLSNRTTQHPLNAKMCKDQLPQQTSFWTMDENMVTSFFFFLIQVTSIRNPPNPPFELI